MANEKRLIDANELFEQIRTLYVVVTGLRSGKGVLSDVMKHYRESVLRIVDEAATVDAVEVVRCKDCVQFDKRGYECVCCRTRYLVKGNDFCSHGERKPVPCKECKHLMFSDCYGECGKGHKGIVRPDDTCEHGERREGE